MIRAAATAGVEPAVRAAIAAVDPQLPVARFQTIDDLRGKIMLEQRYNATVFSAIAGLAPAARTVGMNPSSSVTLSSDRRSTIRAIGTVV